MAFFRNSSKFAERRTEILKNALIASHLLLRFWATWCQYQIWFNTNLARCKGLKLSASSVYTCHDGSQGEMNAFGLLLWCSWFCIFAALAPFTPLFTATGILRHVVPLISGLEGIRSLFELGKAGKVYPWAQFEVGLWAVLPNEWTRYRGDLLLGWKINIKGMNKNSKTPWFSWDFHCKIFNRFFCAQKRR